MTRASKTPNVTIHVPEGAKIITKLESLSLNYVTYPIAIASGACGENAIWEYWGDGTLKILGEGAMTDFPAGTAPWHHYTYRNHVTTVFIGKDITSVGSYSFFELKNVTEVIFEEGSQLKTIGNGAFGHMTSLTSISIPSTVEKFGELAFYYCTSLENVLIAQDSALTVIGSYAFRNTALKTLYVPDEVASIGYTIFYGVEGVVMSVAEGSYAHSHAQSKGYAIVTRAPLPKVIGGGSCGENVIWEYWNDGTLKILGEGAMTDFPAGTAPWHHYTYRNHVTTVFIGKDITSVGSYSFFELKNVTEVIFEEGSQLKTIGNGAFGHMTSLTSISIPSTVEKFGELAFYYSTALETGVIAQDSALTVIGAYAFRNTALKTLYVPDAVTSIGHVIFRGVDGVVMEVAEGSYAHTYAKSKGYAFVIIK